MRHTHDGFRELFTKTSVCFLDPEIRVQIIVDYFLEKKKKTNRQSRRFHRAFKDNKDESGHCVPTIDFIREIISDNRDNEFYRVP